MESSIKHVDKKPLLDLIESYSQLKIPAFQRPYTWKQKQLAELWDSIINNPAYYYIGTIFGIPGSSSELDSSLEVIDGQQRITTISLVLIALRDFVIKHKKDFKNCDELVTDLNKSLIHTPRFSSNKEPRQKIFYWKENINKFYNDLLFRNDLVREKELDDNQKRMMNNYKKSLVLIKDYFKESKNHFEDFRRLITKIQTLYVIVIVAKDDINAFQLFEGLNATGIPLSEVDLIKNAIFKSIHKKADKKNVIKNAEDYWVRMETAFEENSIAWFSKYLRHHWISQNGYVNASDLFAKVKTEKLDKSDLGGILSYLQNLSAEASLYVTLRTADSHRIENEPYLKILSTKNKRELELLLFRLKLYGVDQVYEVILSLTRKLFDSDSYTENQYISDVKKFAYFSLLAKYVSVIPSVYEKIFSNACKIISTTKKKSDLIGVYKELYAEVIDRKTEFAQSFVDEFKYKDNTDTRKLIYLTLYQIYNYKYKVVQKIKFTEDSIEHIIPQKPDQDSGLNQVDIKEFVHKIGNLTLLDRETNGKLSNAPFQIKMKHFDSDILLANRDIAAKYQNEFIKDAKSAIEKRGMDLGELLYEIAITEIKKI